jgi:bifunctional DNase/RNase
MKDKILNFTYDVIKNVNDPCDLSVSKIYVKGVDDNIYINKNKIKFKSIIVDIDEEIYNNIISKMNNKIEKIKINCRKNNIAYV